MAQLISVLTSNPLRLACQLRHIQQAVQLRAGPGRVVGVAYHDNGKALLRKRPGIPEGTPLSELVKDVSSEVLVATSHSIAKTGFSDEDSQPYRFRSWVFGGVGRILPLGERKAVLSTLPEFLQMGVHGRSDAESAFLVTLAHMHESSRRLDHPDLEVEVAADALEKTLQRLDQQALTASLPLPETSAIITNGRLLAAVCRGRPLSYALLEGLSTCELCGITQDSPDDDPKVRPHRTLKAVILASHPRQNAGLQWLDVPQNHLLTVSRSLSIKLRGLN